MITANAGVVLVQDYKANLGLELKIVMDVYERLLSQVWEVKKTRKGLEIPVPKTEDFDRLLRKAATKRPKTDS